MKNKANKDLVLAPQDSLKGFKKLLGSTALATSLVATSFFTGLTTDANASAQAVADNATVVVGTNAAYADGSAVVTISSGTDESSDGWVATFNSANQAVNYIKMTSMTDEDETHDPVVTIDNGRVQVSTNVIGIAATSADVFKFAVAADGIFAIGGNVTHATNKTITMTLTGAGTVEAFGAGAQAFANTILSTSDDAGVLSIKDGGKKTFNGIIGATELGAINTTASSSSEYNAAVDAKVITNLGVMQFDGALGANTITNSGTVTLNAAMTNVAATDQTAVVMHTAGAILNFNDTGAENQNIIATATADGDGTINFFDSSDDAAGAATTLVADSLIGTTGKRIGTLNVGKTDGTKAGNLVTVNAAAIFADNVNVTAGNHNDEDSALSLHEALSSTTITLTAASGADASIKVLTTTAIAGTVDSGTGVDGAGFTIIDADAATQFAGNVGAISAIEKMDIAAIKVDLDGVANAVEALHFSADGTLEFDAAAAQTYTGTITAVNENGLITNANTSGTLTFSGVVGTEAARIKEVSLLDNSDTTFENAVFALDLDIDTAAADDVTTFTIGNVVGNDGATTGALDVAGGTFVLDTAAIAGTTVFDTKEVAASDAGVELRALVIQPAANFTSGSLTFIDGTTAASIDAADVSALSVTNTALTTFTINATAGVADITIDANAKTAATTATELSISNDEAKATHQLMAAAIAADTTLMSTLNDSLTGVNSGVLSTTTSFAKQAAPQKDTMGGSAVATKVMTGTVQGIVSNRMASLRSGDAFVTGMSAGNGMSANSGFIQAFGSDAEQKDTKKSGNTVFGFDSETSGIAIGFDGMTPTGETIGLSASYSTSDITGKGTGKSKNSIDSYTVSVYADKATENGYIEGSLTYGLNDNTNSRIVNTAGLDRTYAGNYDSEQISLQLGGGLPNEVIDGTFVTPFASATGTIISSDAYTETSTTAADALRLSIAQDDINSFVGTVGVKAHMITDYGTPMISLAVNNEFGDLTINSTNTYQGGGTAFKTSTDVEELSATLGLGYAFGNDVTSLNINYEANANEEDYLSHYGTVKIIAKF